MDIARMFLWALIFVAPVIAIVVGGLIWFGRRAKRAGYQSRRAYLAGVPQTDERRRDAVDLALALGVLLLASGLLARARN